MMTVITAFFDGNGRVPPPWHTYYSPMYVDKLYRGFQRHLHEPFRFLCLVDREYEFTEHGITPIQLQRPDLGFLCINEIFQPGLGIERGFFVGLDTVIVGDLTELASCTSDLAMPHDPYAVYNLCNAVVLYSTAGAKRLWDLYAPNIEQIANDDRVFHGRAKHGAPHRAGYPSEFKWLQNVLGNKPDLFIDEAYPGQCISYKAHLTKKGGGPVTDQQTQKYIKSCRPDPLLPAGTRIVYFHGRPKPHELKQTWLAEHWI